MMKICSDIYPRTLSVPRSEQFSLSYDLEKKENIGWIIILFIGKYANVNMMTMNTRINKT